MSHNFHLVPDKMTSTRSSKVSATFQPPHKVLTSWESEKCFQSQQEIFNNMIFDIKQAEQSILMEMFIFSLDGLGNQVLEALKGAAKRGVEVRLLVDGLGSLGFTPSLVKQLKNDGVEVKVFKPIHHFLSRLKEKIIHFKWQSILAEIFLMNSRNHRKLCVIDDQIGWVGSANVCLNHAEWQETMIRVTGNSVTKISEGFNWLWSRSEEGFFKRKLKVFNDNFVSHNISPRNKKKIHAFRIDLINSATKNIKIINPYFIPPYNFLLPLLRAKKRGVEVEILTSKQTDYFFVIWFTRSYYNLLLKKKIKIYELQDRFVHSKILIVDDRAVIGSSNYNYRSFDSDLEIDLLVTKPETIQCLLSKWEESLKASHQITKIKTHQLWARILRFLKPLKKIS